MNKETLNSAQAEIDNFRDKSKKWGLYFKILFEDGRFEATPPPIP